MDGETQVTFPYYRQRKNRVQSIEGVVQGSFKTVCKEYCAESSISGLKHLVEKDITLIERLLWVIILIVGLCCSVTLVRMTFSKYNSAPLVTTQMPEGVSVSNIVFPAVGICSNNRISKRAVKKLATKLLKEERNKHYNEEQMMSLLFGLGQLYDLQPMNADIIDPMELHRALGEYQVHKLIHSLTPRCDDLLVRCVWNNEPMGCLKLFDFRLTVNGYCCTFNYLRLSDKRFIDKDIELSTVTYNHGNKSSFDYDQGLKAMLRLNTSDDFFYNIPLQGAQLQFSDAYDFPDAPSGSFAMQIINPGVQMTVMVSASFTEASRDIQHVPVHLRKCRFHDESSYLAFYTYSDCILKCRMFFLLENCNCTPFNMPKMDDARTCDMRDVACLRTFYAQSIAVRPDIEPIPPELELELVGGGLYCPMCCPSCSKTTYSYYFNDVHIYPEYLNAVPDVARDDWFFSIQSNNPTRLGVYRAGLVRLLRGANFTGASIVHVKYAREVADRYGRNVIMKWFDLISNIGSTCGFVTGFSFVSVLEFIYFFTVKFIREMQFRRKGQIATTKNGDVDSFEDVPRYRPIYWNELTQSTHYANFNKIEY